MAQFVKLNPAEAKQLRTVDERLMSYNVELIAGPKGELPELKGQAVSGEVTVAPGSCAFIVL